MTIIESAFFTVEETAQYLNVPKAQIYTLVKTKGFPVKRIGRHYRINRAMLEKWAERYEK